MACVFFAQAIFIASDLHALNPQQQPKAVQRHKALNLDNPHSRRYTFMKLEK
jgi:hypothetical protein